MRRKAFTLIELLVVVAIISILAAILFPVFARARENARRVSCMSNLKQMGLAMMMYVQDYDESYPYYASGGVGGNPPGGQWGLGKSSGDTYYKWAWPQILYPYHKSLQVMICPSGVGYYDLSNYEESNLGPIRGQYGANTSLFADSTPTGTPASVPNSVKLSGVAAPSQTYAFMDAGLYTQSYWYAIPTNAKAQYGDYLPGIGVLGASCIPGSATYDNLVDDCKSGRHFGGVNVAFADGHVKWLKTSIVSAEAQKPSPNRFGAWNPANS